MKNVIRINLIFLFFLVFSFAYGQTTRTVGNFNKVSASSSVKVKLIKSNEQKVEFKMTRGNEEDLITEVKNNKLIIKIKSSMFNWKSNGKANVKVYYTDLNSVEASAGATVKGDELIHAEEMNVEVSSGATVDVEVEAKNIDAEVSSGARLALEGSAEYGDFEVSSGGNLNAADMICDKVSAEASSGGNLKVHANKKLKADASSGGNIRYKGSAEHTNTDSGWSGSISRMK